jgi:uncharacterized metal-binding protein
MADAKDFSCAICGAQACMAEPNTKKLPSMCPMEMDPETLHQVEQKYLQDEQLRKLSVESARTEASGYCRNTRIEEIMDFARRMGAKKLGIAHCVGLMNEAKVAREIFITGGFEVHTICCKVGVIEKEKLGMGEAEKVRPGQFEPICNPVAQAALLAKAGTQLNVVMGLCVGHDSLFFMHSEVPATVLVAKDRVLGHNPVAALYTSHSYYRKLKGEARK